MAQQVELYVYDLTGGMAKAMSPMLLGTTIEAIYHTSIVVAGTEHFFGYVVRMLLSSNAFKQRHCLSFAASKNGI